MSSPHTTRQRLVSIISAALTASLQNIPLPPETREFSDLTATDHLGQDSIFNQGIWSYLFPMYYPAAAHGITVIRPLNPSEQYHCLSTVFSAMFTDSNWSFTQLFDPKVSPELDVLMDRELPRQAHYKLPELDRDRLCSELLFSVITGAQMTLDQRDACAQMAHSTFQDGAKDTSKCSKMNLPSPTSQLQQLTITAGAFKSAYERGYYAVHKIVKAIQTSFSDIIAKKKVNSQVSEILGKNDTIFNALAVILCVIVLPVVSRLSMDVFETLWGPTTTLEDLQKYGDSDQFRHELLLKHSLNNEILMFCGNSQPNPTPIDLAASACLSFVEFFTLRIMPSSRSVSSTDIPSIRYDNINSPQNTVEYVDNTLSLSHQDEMTVADFSIFVRNPTASIRCHKWTNQLDWYHWLMFGPPVKFLYLRNSAPPRGVDVMLPRRKLKRLFGFHGAHIGADDEDKKDIPLLFRAYVVGLRYLLYSSWVNGFVDDRNTRFPTTLAGRIFKAIEFPILPPPMVSQFSHPTHILVMPHPNFNPQLKKPLAAPIQFEDVSQSDGVVAHIAFVGMPCTYTKRITRDEALQLLLNGKANSTFYNPAKIDDITDNPDVDAEDCGLDKEDDDIISILPRFLQDELCDDTKMFYINDMTATEDIPVRRPYLTYGAILLFNEARKPIAAYISHAKQWVPNTSDCAHRFIYAKFVWKTTMFLLVTVSDHLTIAHLHEGNALAMSTQRKLPITDPLRSLLKPFTFLNTNINFLANESLYADAGLVNRIWAYNYDQSIALMKNILTNYTVKPYGLKIDPSMRSQANQDFIYSGDRSVFYNASKNVEYQYQLEAFHIMNDQKIVDIERRTVNDIETIQAPNLADIGELKQLLQQSQTIVNPAQNIQTIPLDILHKSYPLYNFSEFQPSQQYYINPAYIRSNWRTKANTPDITVLPFVHYCVNHNTICSPANPQWDRVYPMAYDVDRFWAITFDFVESMYDLLALSNNTTDLFSIDLYRIFFNNMLKCLNVKKDLSNEFEKIDYGTGATNQTAFLAQCDDDIAKANKIKFVTLLTQSITNGTVVHEHAGGVADYVQSPNLMGVKLDPSHQNTANPQQFVQEFTTLLLLSQFTGGKVPGLLSDTPQCYYNHLVNDNNMYKHRANWFLYKRDLLLLMLENDFRNKYCRDFPTVSCNPRNLEASMSI